MKRKTKLVLILVILTLMVPMSAMARKKDKEKATGAIDAATFEVLMAAQEMTEAGNFGGAIQQINKLKANVGSMNGYAQAQMYNFESFIHASQENYRAAIGAYENLLRIPEAPAGLTLNAKYAIAQMYFQIEDYQSCIRYMQEWLRSAEKPTSTAHIMLAQAYYASKSYDNALTNVDAAIRIEEANGKKVRENWLRLKAALYYEKGDMRRTADAYELLVRFYPQDTYLLQLAGIYGELGENQKRLSLYDALYENGNLSKESELMNLAFMFVGAEVPYKAGRIIEEGMNRGVIEKNRKNIETLANIWAQANEHKKAIPTLEQAAKLSDKGLLYARLAGVQFDAGNYSAAASAAGKAASKGGLKRPGGNMILKGMAEFNHAADAKNEDDTLKRFNAALASFRRAKDFRENFSDASKWEKYTASEIALIEARKAGAIKLEEETAARMAAEAEADVMRMSSESVSDANNADIDTTIDSSGMSVDVNAPDSVSGDIDLRTGE